MCRTSPLLLTLLLAACTVENPALRDGGAPQPHDSLPGEIDAAVAVGADMAVHDNHNSPPNDAALGGGEFDVVVDSAEWRDAIGAQRPASGRSYVVVRVTVSNTSAPPIATAPSLFTLMTPGIVGMPASSATSGLSSPCGNLSVNAGGSLSCSLAFEVPTGDTPTELDYDDQQGHATSAAIAVVSGGSACAQVQPFMHRDSALCGTCADNLCASTATSSHCTQAQIDCVNTSSGPNFTNACAVSSLCALPAACWSDVQAWYQCLGSYCASSCR